MQETVIEVRDFSKSYGEVVAVDGISFEVHRGEIFGLLGPNGAGKTTTLESLEGLRHPDGGSLRISQIDPVRDSGKLRNLIGVQLQTSGLPESIRVGEVMRLFCAYHGILPRDDVLERFGLADKNQAQYHQLSTGQQRKLALALAVAHEPPVLILDEPTAGLDVATRVALHELMREQQARGTTIVLATHDMAEAEELTDRLAILLHGKIAATGSPLELTSTGQGFTKISVRTSERSILEASTSFPGVQQQSTREDYTIFYSTDIGPSVAAIIEHVQRAGDSLIDLRVERPSLEERFLEITGKGMEP